jgi:hypothetical protein
MLGPEEGGNVMTSSKVGETALLCSEEETALLGSEEGDTMPSSEVAVGETALQESDSASAKSSAF